MAVSIVIAILTNEGRMRLRNASQWLNPLLFFVLCTVLFPLAVSSDRQLLQQCAPGILWIAVCFAQLLAFDSLFLQDKQDGVLEQFLLHRQVLPEIVLGKCLAHWLLTSLPMLLLSPILATMLYLPWGQVGYLLLSLALGTWIISCIGTILSALLINLENKALLLALLLLPLCVPVLIFGVSVTSHAAQAMIFLALLAALASILLPLTPLIGAFALMLAVDP